MQLQKILLISNWKLCVEVVQSNPSKSNASSNLKCNVTTLQILSTSLIKMLTGPRKELLDGKRQNAIGCFFCLLVGIVLNIGPQRNSFSTVRKRIVSTIATTTAI